MPVERVDQMYDLAALEKQQQTFLGFLAQSKEAIIALNDQRITMKSTDVATFTEATDKLNKAIAQSNVTVQTATKSHSELSLAIKAHEQTIDSIAKAQAKGNALTSDSAIELAKLNLQNQAQVKANKEVAQSALGLIDTYGQLKKQYNDVSASAKNLAAIALQTGNADDKNAAAAATAQAKGLHDQLLLIETGVGQAQRNVGNYTGAIKVLQAALAEATGKLNSLSEAEQQNTTAGQKLQKEVSLLGTLVGQQEAGFVSLRREVANSSQALAAMEVAGLANTAGFKELQTEVSNSKRELNEFNKQQALLASESPKIAALTTVAKGLGAAYAVGAGAAALLSDGNEEVEKELNKLVAVMTLLQGLTEFNAVMQERFAIATALSQSKTQLLNTALSVQTALTNFFTASTQAAAVATVEETAAAEAAAAAITQQAVASVEGATANVELAATAEAGAAAMVAEGVATEAATAATTGFATVLIASGIGVAVAAIAAAVVYLIVKMGEWKAETESVIKANAALNNSLGELVSATKEYEAIRSASSQKELKDLQTIVDARKAAGVTALQSLALDKQLAEQKLKTANDDAARYNITKESLKTSQDAARSDADVVRIAEQNKRKFLEETTKVKNKEYDRELEQIDASIKLRKEEAATSKAIFEFANETYQKQVDAKNEIDLNSVEAAKLNADDRRKLILESARIEADVITTKNSFILSNEISTLDQRLTAIKSNAAEQKKVIRAELAATINDPSVSGVDKTIAQKKAAADISKVTQESNQALFEANETARKRELAAELDFNLIRLNDDKTINEKILADQFSTVQNKVDAVAKAGEDQQAIIDAGFKHTIDTTVLNDAELTALDADYKAKTLANAYDTEQKLKAIREKAQADYIAMLQRMHKARIDAQNDTVDIGANSTATDIIGDAQRQIDKARGQKRVDLEKELQRELSEVDKQAALDKLQIQADDLKNELLTVEFLGDSTLDVEKRITENKRAQAALRKGITDDEYNFEEAKRNKRLQQTEQYEEAGLDLIQTFSDASIDKDKNRIAEQQTLNDEKSKRDIEAINASTRSEAEKADAIAIIQARSAEEKKQLDARQKADDYKKAKFDKEIAILKIVAQIALDIATFNYVGAALAGVALIKLIATPIPKYKGGRGKGKEELALVHAGEFIHRGNGSIEPTPAVESLTHLMPSDKVYKDKATMMRELAMSGLPLSNYHVNKGGDISKADMKQFTSEIVGAVGDIKIHTTHITKDGWRQHNQRLAEYDRWVNKYIKN